MDVSSPYPDAPPIARLPVEMLSRVFTLLPNGPDGPSDRSYLYASHVCRHWHAVALKCQDLWTSITYRSQLDWIKIMLERSGAAPLRLLILRDHNWPREFYEKSRCILQELHRAEEMTLNLQHPRAENEADVQRHAQGKEDMLTFVNNSSAPFLRVLRLRVDSNDHLVPSIFGGETPPNLCHLALDNCTLPASFHLFTVPLIHLELRFCRGGWRTMDDFLDVLARLPTLQTLIFHYSLSTSSAITTLTTSRRDRSVPLPNLAYLDIFDNLIIVTYLLPHLSFPSNVCISITGHNSREGGLSGTPQVTADLLETGLRPYLESAFLQGGNFDACTIEGQEGIVVQPGFTLTASRFVEDNGNLQSDVERRPYFKIDIHDFTIYTMELCTAVLQRFTQLPGLMDPKALVVRRSSLVRESSHWLDIASVWKNVSAITLEGSPLYGLVDALSAGHTPPVFPKLSIMTIRGVDLSSAYMRSSLDVATALLGRVHKGTYNGTPVINRLVQAVAQRGARGCSPIKFLIKECDVTPERVHDLEHALEEGVTVLWDGQEKAWTEKEEAKFRAKMDLVRQMGPIDEHDDDDDDDNDHDDDDDDDVLDDDGEDDLGIFEV